MRILTIRLLATFFVAAVTLGFAPAAVAQAKTPGVTQVVALDECDPITFNAMLGPDFCKNVALAALGYATTLTSYLQKQPMELRIRDGTSNLTRSRSKKELFLP
jgi:hypothetical protein